MISPSSALIVGFCTGHGVPIGTLRFGRVKSPVIPSKAPKKNELVALDRSAGRAAELLAVEVLELGAVRQIAGERLEPLEVEQAAVQPLVPDLVMTFTTPPAVRPNSAGAPVAMTWNSLTASSVMSIGARCPPACSPKKPLL